MIVPIKLNIKWGNGMTKMYTYTLGSWEVRKDPVTGELSIWDMQPDEEIGCVQLAEIIHLPPYINPDSGENNEHIANAVLMASAPDLLETLQQALLHLYDVPNSQFIIEQAERYISIALGGPKMTALQLAYWTADKHIFGDVNGAYLWEMMIDNTGNSWDGVDSSEEFNRLPKLPVECNRNISNHNVLIYSQTRNMYWHDGIEDWVPSIHEASIEYMDDWPSGSHASKKLLKRFDPPDAVVLIGLIDYLEQYHCDAYPNGDVIGNTEQD